MDQTIVISTPPHVKAKKNTRSIMLDMVIALLPCAVMGIVYFGWRALMIELVSVLSCVATEFVWFFIANKGFSDKCRNAKHVCKRWAKQFDFTSVVSALILALVVPSAVKWYEILIGGIFAIAIVKMLFGGTGKNLVSPSSAARVFMFLSFAATMNTYVSANFGPIYLESEIYTGATNLSGHLLQGQGSAMHLLDLFLGTGVAGCIGETCKAAILVGYIYLVARGVIKWWQPLLFLLVFGFAAVLMSGFYPCTVTGESGESAFELSRYTFDISLFLPHILSGGVAFASVFMITDYVTSPKGIYGQIFYLIVTAILIALLRYFTGIEVASFVILLMNLFVPLIDKYFIRKPFGYRKEKKDKGDK